MTPFMTSDEISFIEKEYNKNDIVLEWGSGGSTIQFSKLVKKYYSIEHDREWYDKVNSVKPENVSYFFVAQNLPRTFPTKKEEFIDYIKYINKLNVKKFDIILIDGRARAYCAKEALNYIDKNSKVIVHDWERAEYKGILQDYDIISQIHRVGILKKKT